MARGSSRRWATPSPALIPVLVTGIQSTRVCAAGESFQPKDLGWLDSCDKHRNEG
ncbi:integrase [Agrobacterium tumefaciens]|nr:integrase [Agrobacterium tumefaciens]